MPLAAAELFDGLASLAVDDQGSRELVQQVITGWCAEHGLDAAALYLPGDRGLRRRVVVGSRSFPATLPKNLPASLGSLALPGAVLVHPADCRPAPPQPSDAGWPLLLVALHIARLQHQIEQQHFQVNYRVVELEALYDVGLAIAGTLDLDSLSEGILLRAVSLIDARRGALYLYEGNRYLLSRTIGGGAREELSPTDAAGLASEPTAPSTALPGASHQLSVAIDWDGRPAGLLLVGDKESRDGVGPFTANDRRTLSLFANQAAIALENAHLHIQALEKERLEREMVLAGEIQRRILPKGVPDLAGYELAGWYRPARRIGGDYYDFLHLENGHFGFTVGDVSGKGMPAALMVSTLHSALRLLLDRVGIGPELLARLNQHIVDSSTPNKFITLLLAEIDPASGLVTYLNAGHNPGFLIHGAQTFELGANGVPLGLLAGAQYRAGTVSVAPGDLLCLYSDGINEASSPSDEEFGERRLIELLRAHLDAPLPTIVQAIADATEAFAADRPQGDDQTVVLLRRL
jgi:sigma-B regulation protein RsbU (phosphoserine phosphatase)